MKKIYLLMVFFCWPVFADQLTDQMNAFDAVQQQNISNQNARAQAEYKAQQAEQRRLENISIEQKNADRRVQEKAIQARLAASKLAEARAREKEAKEEARAIAIANEEAAKQKAIDDERLADKARLQAEEDEDRAIEIAKKKAELLQLQAISEAKAKRANELLDAELAHAKADTDVVQSGADAIRNISEGTKELQTGIGKGVEANGKTWIIVLTWIVVGLVLIGVVVGVLVYLKNKSPKEDAMKELDSKA